MKTVRKGERNDENAIMFSIRHPGIRFLMSPSCENYMSSTCYSIHDFVSVNKRMNKSLRFFPVQELQSLVKQYAISVVRTSYNVLFIPKRFMLFI